jgi:hypothetical protein
MSQAKKAKSLIPKTSVQTKFDEELVEDVVNFYYTKLRKALENLEDARVGVPVLGIFKVRKKALINSIQHLEEVKENKPTDFKTIDRYNKDNKMFITQTELLQKIEKDEQIRVQRKKDLGQ